nr:5-bromo-4-chloroindolyl phosphate hydrolysis family protein [uncultured Peptoniphilus sp.]
MKDDGLKEKLDRAIRDDNFKDVSDVIEKSVENAIYYTKTGAGAVMRGFRRGINKEEEVLKVNRDPSKVSQNARTPGAWFWLRNTVALGAVGSLFITLIALIEWVRFFDGVYFLAALFILIATIVFGLATLYTHQQMILARDFFRIRREIGDNPILTTDDISTALNKPKSEVVKELNAMIKKDLFPQGRVVEGGELLLLDRPSYDAYKAHYQGHSVYVEETPRPIEKEEEREAIEDDRAKALTDYGDKLSEYKSATTSTELKARIERLEKLLASIDHAVEGDPRRVEELNKFTDYYAPTTMKLIHRYIQFESSSVITDSIRSTMSDILHSLDTVTAAYEKLLDTLYKDDLLELKAEMNVMQTVMKQDGLFDQDLKGES